MTGTNPTKSAPAVEIQHIFELQRAHQFNVANTTASQRIAKLRRLEKALLKHQHEITQAVYADFQKPIMESKLVEIFTVLAEIRHASARLRRWMAPQQVELPTLLLLGSRSCIQYEPKGVVLIIAPWNFPFLLTLGPLVSAICAGNCVMVKPSELTAASSAVMAKIITEVFEEKEVALIQGDAETAQALLALPFNHIFYTGSPAIGKIIMAAAAKHLSSVTLELGGKSPTIIDASANLELAARRIAWSKFTNNGQTCVSPDYILVQEQVKDALLEKIAQVLLHFFGKNPKESDSYARIINPRHFERLKSYIDDALQKGSTLYLGGNAEAKEKYIEPTILTNVSMDTLVMQEEVFGPILPVLSFQHLEEAIKIVNAGERPLSLYLYSRNKKNVRHILKNTRSGGVAINHSEVHFFNYNLPFGGVNNSGIGKSHGWYGFEAFSNAKSVFRQSYWGALELAMPPYNAFKEWLVNFIIKWF